MTKEQLEKEIQQANAAYSAGIPFMTDEEYDILWKQLFEIDPSNNLLYHTAQNINTPHNKIAHKQPIFGTNKAFCMEDLKPFLTRFGSLELVIEPKYDGCAAVITRVETGCIITLEGDGTSGGDITHLMSFIDYPYELRHFQAVEILIPFKDWKPEYGKNPRNTVAGWLARVHDAPDAIMTAVPHNHGPLKQFYWYNGNLEEFGELLLKLFSEWSTIYPMDGLMIKVADEKQRLISGHNGKTNNWSIAWKPPIQTKQTLVKKIEWNVSRLGRVIPTVIYESIELCGTTNSRVTGNNATWLKEKNITEGAIITVGKAGEIIPKIIDVKPFNKCVLPMQCPKCNELLETDGVHLVCKGENCIAQKVVSIAYFYSHKGVKIDGIGEGIIEALLEDKECYEVLLIAPWALLDMYSYGLVQPIMKVLGQTITVNIFKEVKNASGNFNMAHFISGLGLPGLSYKSALRLCQYLKTGNMSINVSYKARENFANAVLLFTQAKDNLKHFSFSSIPNPAKALFCITGTLSMPRDEMVKFLESKDFGFLESVTKETNYLVVGEDPGKIKIQKAEKHNIPQITEDQLFKLLKEN